MGRCISVFLLLFHVGNCLHVNIARTGSNNSRVTSRKRQRSHQPIISTATEIGTEIASTATEIASTEYKYREFQPAPEGGWESVDPSARPPWWRPEGSVLPPKGAKVALAFRGDYHRWLQSGHRNFPHRKVCSDYWVNKDNVDSMIVAPLEAVGSQVRLFFHTFKDKDCPQYDQKLVEDMKPAHYKFDENYYSSPDCYDCLSYTWVEVFKLAVEDDWADVIILARFDVQYNAPITSWNMEWDMVNVPFWHRSCHCDKAERSACHGGRDYVCVPDDVNSDILATVPKKQYQVVLSGLQNYSQRSRSMYYFQRFEGIHEVHAIDPRPAHDANTIGISFAGIVRDCSEEYDACMER